MFSMLVVYVFAVQIQQISHIILFWFQQLMKQRLFTHTCLRQFYLCCGGTNIYFSLIWIHLWENMLIKGIPKACLKQTESSSHQISLCLRYNGLYESIRKHGHIHTQRCIFIQIKGHTLVHMNAPWCYVCWRTHKDRHSLMVSRSWTGEAADTLWWHFCN